MQNEDDIRSLAKLIDLIKAISIIVIIIHIYWFCYGQIEIWNMTANIADKVLMNFHKNTGIFSHPIWTKLTVVGLLSIACLGTKGVKHEKITWLKIMINLSIGIVFFFLNWWILDISTEIISNENKTFIYIATLAIGYICLLNGGVWMRRILKNDLMKDVFNIENESFMQETTLMTNEYSVNLPTKFQYNQKEHQGWINIVNPFRASIVLGTPGSGKSYAIINNYIK